MQRRNIGKAMYCLVAILALVSTFALVGCGGGGGDDETTSSSNVSNVSNTPVPVNASTVQAVVGQPLTIPNGAIFDPSIGSNTPATFTFASPTTFSLGSGGATSSGNTAFGSCTLTYTQGPLAPKVITFTTCVLQITGSNVPVGGGAASGTLTLTLSGPFGSSTSLAITVQISILADGTLVLNGVSTGITISGTTGTTGTGGTP